jgi:type VI protein secretion system component VasK
VSRIAAVLLVILIVVAALALLAVVSGLVVWAASGLGWVLINWLRLPFTPFEATLLSLVTFVAVTWSAWRLLVNFVSLPLGSSPEEEDEDEEWDEDEEDDEEEDEEPEQAQHVSSIPKWRQPIRRASDGLPIVNPDDRCPCGSGRKYKNCHGRSKQ